jgi:hypothetical protein
MKYLLMTLAVVMICAGPVLASDGNLSKAQLAKMGLSGMAVMSDDQGTAVRGMGYQPTRSFQGSVAFGASYAKVTKDDPMSAGTINGYLAVDQDKGHGSLAGGANISTAGTVKAIIIGGGGGLDGPSVNSVPGPSGPTAIICVNAVFAGGASVAFTK